MEGRDDFWLPQLCCSVTRAKGRHAFIITTHTDKQHIHCHIYYNSTTLDCTQKFRNFWGSSFALRRLSDRLCLENGLSIVENPKPRSEKSVWRWIFKQSWLPVSGRATSGERLIRCLATPSRAESRERSVEIMKIRSNATQILRTMLARRYEFGVSPNKQRPGLCRPCHLAASLKMA